MANVDRAKLTEDVWVTAHETLWGNGHSRVAVVQLRGLPKEKITRVTTSGDWEKTHKNLGLSRAQFDVDLSHRRLYVESGVPPGDCEVVELRDLGLVRGSGLNTFRESVQQIQGDALVHRTDNAVELLKRRRGPHLASPSQGEWLKWWRCCGCNRRREPLCFAYETELPLWTGGDTVKRTVQAGQAREGTISLARSRVAPQVWKDVPVLVTGWHCGTVGRRGIRWQGALLTENHPVTNSATPVCRWVSAGAAVGATPERTTFLPVRLSVAEIQKPPRPGLHLISANPSPFWL